MPIETTYVKLCEITENVMQGRVPRDDTLLEKLINFIQSSITHPDDVDTFLKHVPFVDLVKEHILTSQVARKEAFCFACLLTTHLTSTCDDERILRLHIQLLLLPVVSELWQHPTVRNAVILGAHCVLKPYSQLVWFLESDLSAAIIDCLKNDSLFVTKSAVKLTAQCFISIITSLQGETLELHQKQILLKAKQNLDNLLTSPFLGSGQRISEFDGGHLHLRVVCDILLHLTNDDIIISWFQEAEVDSKLVQILKSNQVMDHVTMDTIVDVLVWSAAKVHTQSDALRSLPRDLYLEHNIHRAVSMATLLSAKVPSLAENMERDVLIPVINSCADGPQVKGMNKTQLTKLLSCCMQAVQAMEPSSSLLKLVVKLLHASQKSTNENICNNRRLQQVSIKTASYLLTRWQHKEAGSQPDSDAVDSLFDVCVSLLLVPSLSSTFITELFSCVSAVLLTDTSLSRLPSVGWLCGLRQVVSRRLCDVQWEVRDSAIQFLTTLCRQHSPSLHSWLCDCDFPGEMWLCVSDQESYVRGAALTGLAALTTSTLLWNQLTSTLSQEEILDKIDSILSEDLEAFARRAAVTFLHDYWKSQINNKSKNRSRVALLMKNALHDFDWEVKLAALKFWEDYIDLTMEKWSDTCDVNTAKRCKLSSGDDFLSRLTNLLQTGCSDILQLVETEHDRTVQLEICKLCAKLKKLCKDSDGSEQEQTPEILDFLRKLHAVDLDKLTQESSQSTDEYVNPESLLDDLVTSLTCVEVIAVNGGHCMSDDGGDDDYVVDCY